MSLTYVAHLASACLQLILNLSDNSCRQITGQAATVSRQPLATYQWPESRPAVLQWLEQSIQYAVQKLDRAPFLELVFPSKHETVCSIYPVDEAVVDSPQVSARLHLLYFAPSGSAMLEIL